MALTKEEFYTLRAIVLGEEKAAWGVQYELSAEEEAQALASLMEKGYVANGNVTDAGLEALEPHRAKNAIFLAAGFSSRFTPISFDTPKGLMEVRGEILAERQIRQLHEAGVTDITIVVGYRAEKFEYLADKYGVKTVFNPDFPYKNAMSSVYHTRHLLGNTYILDSDHYIEPSMFSPYVWESFYPVLQDDAPDEWYMVYDENHYIIDMEQSGHGERLHGPAFITEEMAAVMMPYLEADYADPERDQDYWEYILWEARGIFKVHCPCMPRGRINEFDSMADLAEFDPEYIYKVKSPSLDNICATLGCDRADIHDCYSISHNATNASCHFAVGDKEYVYFDPKGYEGSEEGSWSITPFVPEAE